MPLKTNQTERSVLAAIKRVVSKLDDVRLMRNCSRSIRTATGFVRMGLGAGTSDLVGWKRVVVTADMVGKPVAVFVAVEAKNAGGTGKLSKSQAQFLDSVEEAGGIAVVADSAAIVSQRLG